MQAKAAALASAKPWISAGFSKTLDAGATHPAARAASRVTGPQSTACDESSFECPMMSRSAEVGVPLSTYFLTSRKVCCCLRTFLQECTTANCRGISRVQTVAYWLVHTRMRTRLGARSPAKYPRRTIGSMLMLMLSLALAALARGCRAATTLAMLMHMLMLMSLLPTLGEP